VFALVRDPEGSKLKRLITDTGRNNIHVIKGDITDPISLKAAAKKVSDLNHGKLDILINNAALMPREDLFKPLASYEGKEDEFMSCVTKTTQVNAIGPIITSFAFLPLLRNGTRKQILTLASGVGTLRIIKQIQMKNVVPYAMSKAALNVGLVKLGLELGPDGFIIIGVSPGLVDTEDGAGTSSSNDALAELKRHGKELKRNMQSPQESVSRMLKIFDGLTKEDNMGFFGHDGNNDFV